MIQIEMLILQFLTIDKYQSTYLHQRGAEKVLFSFSFRFKASALPPQNRASIPAPSPAISFARPFYPKPHGTSQHYHHLPHAAIAWESFPLWASLPSPSLSSSKYGFALIAPRWKERGYFTDFHPPHLPLLCTSCSKEHGGVTFL